MRKSYFVMFLIILGLFWSCANSSGGSNESVDNTAAGDNNGKNNIILVQMVDFCPEDSAYRAYLYSDMEYEKENLILPADVNVSYQWQISEDNTTFNDIEGENKDSYIIKESDLQKYIRVRVVQSNGTKKLEPVDSPGKIVINEVSKTDLRYDGIIEEGQRFDFAKIRGEITDMFGFKLDASEFTWGYTEAEGGKELVGNYSRYFSIPMYKSMQNSEQNQSEASEILIFEMKFVDVFANVQKKISAEELPALREDVLEISAGKADFESINMEFEISYDGGNTYKPFPEEAFITSAGDKLYIRKKAQGIPDQEGYLKESKALEITVQEKNIGRKTAGGGIISGLEKANLILTKTVEGNIIKITVSSDIFDSEELAYLCMWTMDEAPLTSNTDAIRIEDDGESKNAVLIIDKSKLGKDTYDFFCHAEVYIGGVSSFSSIIELSNQISIDLSE